MRGKIEAEFADNEERLSTLRRGRVRQTWAIRTIAIPAVLGATT